MNRMAGHILLWLGFLVAAFWTCYQLEITNNKWATIPWAWYGLSMLIGLGGVMILRSTAKSFKHDAAINEANYATLENCLVKLNKGVEQLRGEMKKDVRPSEIVRFIDDELAEPFADFADARQALANRHGLQFFADVMTQFASAERFINRTWSAAADGYIDEVTQCIDQAITHLRKAQELMSSVGMNESI